MGRNRITFLPSGCPARVEQRTTLLEAAQKAAAGLAADCGGAGTCGRCRVRVGVSAPLTAPTLAEEQVLSSAELADGVRLACQARVLGPVTATILPGSAVSTQRLQVGGGAGPVNCPPPTALSDIELSPKNTRCCDTDWERLLDALPARGEGAAPAPEPVFLRGLSHALNASGPRVRLGLRGPAPSWVLPGAKRPLGLAVDLGTTKVAVYLADLADSAVLASGGAMNPQIAYGEDVMSRIAAVMEGKTTSAELGRLVVGAIAELAARLCADSGAGLDPDDIVECVVVGNTVMHHLALGLDVRGLGMAPFRPVVRAALECKAADIGLAVNPQANVYFPPNVSGFIGSDHLAMLLASGAADGGGAILGVDIGTNTEISLCVGGVVRSCSASSGPSFEGATIRHGMRAAEGAVERVRIRNGRIAYTTIGRGRPVGFCGSGVLDAVAQLRACGALNRHGAFEIGHPLVRRGAEGPEVAIVPAAAARHGRDLSLSRKDVGRIQLAKAAIRAGIDILLRQAQTRAEDIAQCVVAGAFGTYLDLHSALAVGLFPPIAPERFRQVGNAAGMGARLLLGSGAARDQVRGLAATMLHCELTAMPDFRERYVASLWL